MAQQTRTDDGSTEAQNDPELAAATMAQAADSLQVYLGRDAMREFGREHGSRSSGTKQEMAESMLAEAREEALALLVEEGVELRGDLVEDDSEQAQDDEQEDAEAQEAEDEDEQDDDSSSGQQATTVGELLARDPDEHRLGALTMSEKQTAAILAALANPEGTKEDVAEAADCSARYAATTCERWGGTEDQVEAVEAEGGSVAAEYTEVGN